MSKSTITYLGEADEVTFGSTVLPKGKAVEVTDEAILNKARTNRFFEVKGADTKEDAKQPKIKPAKAKTPHDRGAEAKAAGKDRTVPVSYRGKDAEKEWLAGYDTPAVTTSGSYPAATAAEIETDEA